MPPGRAGRPRRRPGRSARVLRRQRDRDRGAARGHGPQRRAPPGAGLVHGGLRGRRLRLPRARPGPAGPAGRERSGRGPVRAPLPAVLGAPHRGHRHRGRAAGPPQRLRGQQARPGASGRHLGPDDRRVRGRAALPQRVRPPDAAGHAVLRGGGDLPVRARGRPVAAGLRGRPAAPRLRPRARRGPGQPGRAAGRCAGLAAGLQRGQRRAAHGRRDGHGAGRRVRRPRAHGDRAVPAGRRPAHRGLTGGRHPRARVPGRDEVRRRDDRVRPRPAAPGRWRASWRRRWPVAGRPLASPPGSVSRPERTRAARSGRCAGAPSGPAAAGSRTGSPARCSARRSGPRAPPRCRGRC